MSAHVILLQYRDRLAVTCLNGDHYADNSVTFAGGQYPGNEAAVPGIPLLIPWRVRVMLGCVVG